MENPRNVSYRPIREGGRQVRELRAFKACDTIRWTPTFYTYELPRKRCLVPTRQLLINGRWCSVYQSVDYALPMDAETAELECQRLALSEVLGGAS